MNPRGPGDQVNNRQGGGDFFGAMITGTLIMFGIIWLFGVLFD